MTYSSEDARRDLGLPSNENHVCINCDGLLQKERVGCWGNGIHLTGEERDNIAAYLSRIEAERDALVQFGRAAAEAYKWWQAERMFMPHQSEWTLDTIWEQQGVAQANLALALAALPTPLRKEIRP